MRENTKISSPHESTCRRTRPCVLRCSEQGDELVRLRSAGWGRGVRGKHRHRLKSFCMKTLLWLCFLVFRQNDHPTGIAFHHRRGHRHLRHWLHAHPHPLCIVGLVLARPGKQLLREHGGQVGRGRPVMIMFMMIMFTMMMMMVRMLRMVVMVIK